MDFCAVPCVERVERSLKIETGAEARELATEPGDGGDGAHPGDAGFFKVIGLHPDPAAGERCAPVFFKVAAAISEIDGGVVVMDATGDGMVEAKNAMIALHKRNEGVPAHVARAKKRDGPGNGPGKVEIPGQDLFGGVEVETDPVVVEVVGADGDGEFLSGCLEVFDGKTMVVGCVADAVEDLNEGMSVMGGFVFCDAGDNSENVVTARVYKFIVPAFEIVITAVMPLVDPGVPDFSDSIPH